MSEHQQATVLIVEDDEQVRAVFAQVLQGAGYRVLQAAHGNEALGLLRMHPVQVVISDLVMPEMEGLELIRFLRRTYPKLKIIACSGAFGEAMLHVATRFGANAALAKPISSGCLLATLQAVLREGNHSGGANFSQQASG